MSFVLELVVTVTISIAYFIILNIIEQVFSLKNEVNYILSRSSRPLTSVQVEDIIRNCGKTEKVFDIIRCSPHTLRHYFSQANIRNGLDVYSIS